MKLVIATYAELRTLISAWSSKRRMPLVAVTSRPGLGKTEAARSTATSLVAADSAPLTLDTHVTPMQLYVDLFNHRNQPVILDDLTDRVLKNEIALSILKSLCDSREERRVEYNSSSLYLDQHDIPRSFTTTSPVLLLSNVFAVVSPAQFALQSRSVHADFTPSTTEVIAYCRTWAKDLELLKWFDSFREQFPFFSARDYAVCEQLKESGLDWQDYAMRSSDVVLAEVLRLQKTLPSVAARIAAFSGSRATYFRKLAVLANKPQKTTSIQGRLKKGEPNGHATVATHKFTKQKRTKREPVAIARDGKEGVK